MNKKVTVIVPIYNAEKYLEDCLYSIVNQTYKNLQIILINDQSIDQSKTICKKYANSYSNILFLENNVNKGVSYSRNIGIKYCNGDYVTFVDADDILDKNFVSEAIDIFYKDDSIDSVFFEYKKVSKDGVDFRCEKLSVYGRLTSSEAYRICLEESFRFACAKVYKTKLVKNLQFNTNIYRGEDTLFLCECLVKMKYVFISNKKYYDYIQSENSATRTTFNIKKVSVLDAFDKIIVLTKKYYPDLLEISKKEYCLEVRMLLRELSLNDKEYNELIKEIIERFRLVYKSINKKSIFILKHRLILLLIFISPKLYFFINKKIKSI